MLTRYDHSNPIKLLATRALALSFIASMATPASALVIGTLDQTRTNTALGFSVDYSNLRSALATDGHTLNSSTDTASITPAYLSTVNVFISSIFMTAPFSPPAATIAAEVTALKNWVSGGGMLIFSGEHGTFTAAFNDYTQPFGITMGGYGFGYNAPVVFVNDPTDPYLQNAVAGSTLPINNRGYIASVTSPFTTLATGVADSAELFAIKMAYGSGTVVAFADTTFMNNPGGETGLQFLRNAVNQAGLNGGGGAQSGGSSTGPAPGALLLRAAGLPWLLRSRARA